MQLSGPRELEGAMEVADYPAPPVQGLVSAAVAVVSVALLYRVLSWGHAPQAAVAFLVLSLATFAALSVPLWGEFRGVRAAVAEGKPHVERADAGSFRAPYWAVVFLAALVGPFLASAYLEPGAWFGAVLGVTAGFPSSQLVFVLRVRGWERARGVRLERYTVTRGGFGERVVVERGVRVRR